MIWVLAFLVAMAYGAFARRVMGGVGGKWPGALGKTQRAAVVAMLVLPLAIPVAAAVDVWVGLLALAVAGLSVSTGDGDQTDMGTWFGPEPDKPFWGFVNDNLGEAGAQRDFIGLLVSGFATTVAPGVLLAIAGNYVAGLVLAVCGFLKAPVYAFAYMIPSKVKNLKQGRELGEAFWGASVGFASVAALLLSA